jgi:outer membrane protein assembly factor BamB
METWTPTAAVYAGSLARTYEYRTTGVPTTPQIRWSFVLKPGARITCPILVSQDRVYVADSAGYLTALDAPSGDLVWSFPTDWVENPKKTFHFGREGVTAFCLDGGLGYVASARDTLYELDLHTGQVLRSWNPYREDAVFDATGIEMLFIHNNWLFFVGVTNLHSDPRVCWYSDPGIYRFHPSTEERFIDMIPMHGWDFLPSICQRSNGEPDIVFALLNDFRRWSQFTAAELPGASPDDPVRELWFNGDYDNDLFMDGSPDDLMDDTKNTCHEVGLIFCSNTPVMDGVLYAFTPDGPWDEDEEGSEDEMPALLALDPQSGAVKWRTTFPSDFFSVQLVAASNQIFLVAKNRVESIDVKTHQPRWNWEAAFPVCHALVADGLLYVLGVQGEIIALEVSTGARRWSWLVEGEILKDWSTIDKGTLFLATTRALYALSSCVSGGQD